MKLVTYRGSSNEGETVLYTADGVRLGLDAPTAVDDGDVPDKDAPELVGHDFDVTDAPEGVAVGDVVRGDGTDLLTNDQLKEKLAELGQPTTGNKRALVRRLKDASKSND